MKINPCGKSIAVLSQWCRRLLAARPGALTGIALFAVLLSAQGHASNVKAWLDRDEIREGDSVEFIIRVDEISIAGSPDLSVLEKNFEVYGTSQNSRHVRGSTGTQSWTEWRTSLLPKRTGIITIPAIEVAGEKTEPLTLTVKPAPAASSDKQQPVFLEAEVDLQDVYVQQQLVLTIRLYRAIQLDNMNLSDPEFDTATVEELSQTTFLRHLNGTKYRVHELRYAIFPREPGELIIPEMVFTATERIGRRSLFSRPGQGRPIRRLSDKLRVHVKPIPPGYPTDQPWLPARELSVEQNWSEAASVSVGESITRSLHLKAVGITAAQLPDFDFGQVDWARFYPERPQRENATTDDAIVGNSTNSIAVIPTREGSHQLPTLRIPWWNTRTDTLEELVIPGAQLSVQPSAVAAQPPRAFDGAGEPAAAAAPTSPAPVTAGTAVYWMIATAVSLLAAIISATLWWQTRRELQRLRAGQKVTALKTKLSEQQAFKALLNSCRQNNAQSARRALINWARVYWEDETVQSTDAIAPRAPAELRGPLRDALLTLDQALYGTDKGSAWTGDTLIGLLKQLRSSRPDEAAGDAPLPPLYYAK